MQGNAVEAAPVGGGAAAGGAAAVPTPFEQQQQVALKRLRAVLAADAEVEGGAAKRRRWCHPYPSVCSGGSTPASPAASQLGSGEEGQAPSSSGLLLVPQPGCDCGTSAAQQLQQDLGAAPAAAPGRRTQLPSQAAAAAAPIAHPRAPLPGSDASGGTQEQAVAAAQCPGRGPAEGGGGGSGMAHAASRSSLVPSSGPALAQISNAEPPPPLSLHEPQQQRAGTATKQLAPAPALADGGGQPSSRLGTLKRDRSPSNGTTRGASSGRMAQGGRRRTRAQLAVHPPLPAAASPRATHPPAAPPSLVGEGAQQAQQRQPDEANDPGDGQQQENSGGDGSGGRNGSGSGEGSNLEQLAAATLGNMVTTVSGHQQQRGPSRASSDSKGRSSGDNSSQADSGYHPGAASVRQPQEARQQAAAAVFAAQHTACIKQQHARTLLNAQQQQQQQGGAAAASAKPRSGAMPPPPPRRHAYRILAVGQQLATAGTGAAAGYSPAALCGRGAAVVDTAAAGSSPVQPWLPLLDPSLLSAAAQASGLANARPLLAPISSFYSDARDSFVRQVQQIMQTVAGFNSQAPTQHTHVCNTEAVMSACFKAYEIIQSFSTGAVEQPPTPLPAAAAAAASFFGLPRALLGCKPVAQRAALDGGAATAAVLGGPPAMPSAGLHPAAAAAAQAAAAAAPTNPATAAALYQQLLAAQQQQLVAQFYAQQQQRQQELASPQAAFSPSPMAQQQLAIGLAGPSRPGMPQPLMPVPQPPAPALQQQQQQQLSGMSVPETGAGAGVSALAPGCSVPLVVMPGMPSCAAAMFPPGAVITGPSSAAYPPHSSI